MGRRKLVKLIARPLKLTTKPVPQKIADWVTALKKPNDLFKSFLTRDVSLNGAENERKGRINGSELNRTEAPNAIINRKEWMSTDTQMVVRVKDLTAHCELSAG